MNHDQLIELDRLLRTAPRKVNAYIDSAIDADFPAASPEAGDTAPTAVKRPYNIRVVGPHVGNKPGDVLQQLGELTAIAGLAATGEASTATISEQLLACMRLATDGTKTHLDSAQRREFQWINDAALKRISELLLAYPALLHPRLTWDASYQPFQNASLVTAPLLHTLVKVPGAALPTHDEAFCKHPVIDIAMKARGARTPGALQSTPHPAAGKTPVKTLSTHSAGRPALLASLLRMETVRAAAGLPTHLSSDEQRSELSQPIGFAFLGSWRWPGAEGSLLAKAQREFIEALKACPGVLRPNLAQLFLMEAKQVAFDIASIGAIRNIVAAPDAPQRTRALIRNLVDCGTLSDNTAAARAVAAKLFHPLAVVSLPEASALTRIDHSLALQMVAEFVAFGLPLEELRATVSASHYPCPDFLSAIDARLAEQSMTSIIQAAPAPAAANEPSVAMHLAQPRRAGV